MNSRTEFQGIYPTEQDAKRLISDAGQILKHELLSDKSITVFIFPNRNTYLIIGFADNPLLASI